MSTDKRKVLKPLKEMETIWHPDSTLVFKSKTEKVVTGRWINSEFLPLDEDAIELCAQWSFKYDQELYDELMAEEEEEGGEDVEGDVDETGEGDVGETGEDGDVGETGEDGDVGETVEDDATSENDVTENVVETTQTSSKDLDHLTSDFTSNLNSYFQTLTGDFSSKISILETKLSNKSDEFVKMTEDRDKMKDELSKMTEDRDKMKDELSKMTEDRDKIKEECEKFRAKFEGFKNFFMT
jgi:uncharacterized phage infection (PIP) family protein YhgE